MAASTSTPRGSAATYPPIPLHRRLYGFGSVYGKTVRDSRLAFIIATGLLAGMAMLMGAALPTVFPTPQARLEVNALVEAMPASMVNLFGQPVGLGTLGGYMTWKYGAIFVMGTALWSIMALSSTLASEARRGSLDMVATTPLGKQRIAIEKLAAHLTLLWLSMAILALAAPPARWCSARRPWATGSRSSRALGFGLWIGSIAMVFGGLAFLLAPVLGRAGSAGIASHRDGGAVARQRRRGTRCAGRAQPVPLDGRPHPAGRAVRLAAGRVHRAGRGRAAWPAGSRCSCGETSG